MAYFTSSQKGDNKEFIKDQVVWYYKKGDTFPVKATIVARHEDGLPDIYYTIKFSDGREKQTDQMNLFDDKANSGGGGGDGGGGGVEGGWICAVCTFENRAENNFECRICRTKKPTDTQDTLTAHLTELDSILADIGTEMKNCEVVATEAFDNIKLSIEQCKGIFDNRFTFPTETDQKRSCFTKIQSLENKQALLKHLSGLIKAGFDDESLGSPRTLARVAERKREITTQLGTAMRSNEQVAYRYLDSCMTAADEAIVSTKKELRESMILIQNKIISTVAQFDKKMDAIRERSVGCLEESSERRKLCIKLELFNGREQIIELILKILM
jgi:hypothetical protein